jgi:tetratricopeptide (TPR) repeat protein
VTPKESHSPYTLSDIEGMLGLGRSAIASLIKAGVVSPERGARNAYRFSFQDVVLLRTAHALSQANIPARRMLRALQALKAKLPEEVPLSGLRIKAIGNEVAVRAADAHWETASGQLLMDFEVVAQKSSNNGSVKFLQRPDKGGGASEHADKPSAAQWFKRAQELEDRDPAQAEAAYRQVLRASPGHTDAAINLSALLCELARNAEALAVCDAGLLHAPGTALLHFNRGVALEDQGRLQDALNSYSQCLALDPQLADAHYNSARLHERLGEAKKALRHYSAYRRLQPSG